MTEATNAQSAWPTELKVADQGRVLKVAFEDGAAFELPAEYLRVMSPSAEVKGHSRKERRVVGGKRHVAIVAADPVGTYAVKLGFDDMHNTGIYTWGYLYELGRDQAGRWQVYLDELESKRLTRDRVGEANAEM